MPYHLHKHVAKKSGKKQKKTLIDPLMGAAAVIQPLMATPQVYAIYTARSDAGVSLWTWLGFMLIGLVFLFYGILHHIKPFIVTQVLWFAVDLLVVIGVLLYR